MADLQQLALKYNANDDTLPINTIPLDSSMSALKLVISLWQRDISVSFYGEPYDMIFAEWSPLTSISNEDILEPVEKTFTYILLNSKDEDIVELLFHNISVREDLNAEILSKLNIPSVYTLKDFVKLLPTLKLLDLVYIALEAENYGLYRYPDALDSYIKSHS